MNARRGFLTMVGGAVFNGTVLQPAGALQPTLILPPSAILPTARPLLDAHRCQMDVFLEIERHVPKGMFLDWLENGLQLAERHRRPPADLASEEDRIEAAVAKHGSVDLKALTGAGAQIDTTTSNGRLDVAGSIVIGQVRRAKVASSMSAANSRVRRGLIREDHTFGQQRLEGRRLVSRTDARLINQHRIYYFCNSADVHIV